MSHLPIPGSVHLVAVQGDAAFENEKSARGSIILHPRPSDDFNDPLNWSARRKRLAAFCLLVYVLAAGMGTTALYSVLTPISDDTAIPLSILNAGTGYMFFLLGWGNFFFQPLAMTFGKRPIYLISLIGNLGMCIWMPYISTDGAWLANKVLQGFFVAPIESLIEISITDLYFAHERNSYIGLYALSLFGSNYLAPLVAGFIADGMGWHWVMYWSAIWNAGAFVILFFLLEETNYTRAAPNDASAQTQEASAEKDEVIDRIHPVEETDLETYLSGRRTLHGSMPAFTSRLTMFHHRWATNKQWLTMIYRPILFLRFPIVVWAGFIYGCALVWYNVLNATASLILSAEPYGFAASMVGLMYAAPLLGAFVSAAYAGWFGDKFAIWFARRKQGVREPEDRLWIMTVCILTCPTALILWGVGASRDIAWIGLAFGMGMSAFTTGVVGIVSIGYTLDSYKELGGEIMITVMVIRNSLSFAIGYGITPWLDMGLQNTFITAAMVGLVVNASFLVMIKFGKGWRAASAEKYWNYVATSAHAH